MNLKKMLGGTLALAMLLSACGDDDKVAPKDQFKFAGEDVVSLSDGNLYLVSSGNFETGHAHREYFITDGIYESGEGWSLNDYTDATYVLAVQLAVPEGGTFEAKAYPLYNSITDLPENGSLGWLSLETDDDVYFETPDGTINGSAVKISGGLEDGDEMTISFSGALTNYKDADVDSKGKIYFKGEVQDVRITAAPVRKSAPVAKGGVK